MDLKSLKAELLSVFESYSRANFIGAKFVKIVLIIGGALAWISTAKDFPNAGVAMRFM